MRELLADDPELLAIADALARTQARARRVRPGRLAGAGVLAAAAVALAVTFWPGGGSSAISGTTAYAAVGGTTRTLEVRVPEGPGTLRVRYDRLQGRLSAIQEGRTLSIPSADLPPSASTLAPSLKRRFGSGLGPVVSFVSEYPGAAKAGRLESIAAPTPGWQQLEWVRYRSTLGYDVEVGLRRDALIPAAVSRRGSRSVVPLIDVYSTS